jgi:2-iminobutanoate/2-iminopropanoate deaminase
MRPVDVAGLSTSPLTAAIVSRGVVYTSGQVGRDRDTGIVAEGLVEQMHTALANLDFVLEAAGSSRAQVVKTVVFLPRREDFMEMNRIYGEHFGEPRPARSTVVCDLAHESLRFEIEAVAELPDPGGR